MVLTDEGPVSSDHTWLDLAWREDSARICQPAGPIQQVLISPDNRTLVSSGITDLWNWHSFSFSVHGAFPVTLTGYLNGAPKLSATDFTASAFTGSRRAGIAATAAGILFDDFKLTGALPSSAGTPDAGPP